MLFQSIAVAAVFAVASNAAGHHHHAHMSSQELFGSLAKRGDQPGYSPTQTFCGMGRSCAEACGSGFQMCPSTDNSIHCYDPTASHVCCPGGGGMSCEPGYFCAGSTGGEQLCCKEPAAGKSIADALAECQSAKKLSVALTSQSPVPTTTSSASSSTSLSVAKNTTLPASKTKSSVSGEATGLSSNGTTTPSKAGTTGPSTVPTSGPGVSGASGLVALPAGGALMALAGIVVALL